MVYGAPARPLVDASTRTVDAADRFDHFCALLGDVYRGILPRRSAPGDFIADVTAFPLTDGGVISRMRAPAHAATRPRRSAGHDDEDALFLNVVADAPARLDHLGERLAVRAGQPVVIDNSRPFDLTLGTSRGMRLYSLRLPRTGLAAAVDPQQIAGLNRRLATGAGDALAAQAHLMQRAFDAGQIGVADAMARAMVSLLAAALDTETDGRRSPVPETSFAALTALATDRLDDAEFGLTELARAAGISPRSVQNAFAAEGTTWSSWALAARLDAARTRIQSPAWAGRSLEHIALASGFRDVSHFHRAFRGRFEESPGAFRPMR